MSKDELEKSSEPLLEPLDQVEQLITQGKIKEAMEIIEGREKAEGIEELRWRILESKCRNIMGEYTQVIEFTDQLIMKLDELDEPVEEKGEKERKRIRIDILNEQAFGLLKLGRLEDGLEKVEEGMRLVEELAEKNRDKERKVNLLIKKGDISWLIGDLNESKECFEKGLAISKELGNKELIAKSVNGIGIFYYLKGELDQALIFYEKSLAMREKTGNKTEIAKSMNNMGIVYQELGVLETALDFLKQALAINKEIGNKFSEANVYFHLICVAIELEEVEQARTYLSVLQLINEQEEDKHVDLCSRLAEALILKTSKRRKNLTKAEEILEEIVKEEIISLETTVQALVILSELLLEELLLTAEEEILVEVEEKVGMLFEVAKKQQSYRLLAESYWLKAQIALVKLDLKEARSLMTEAQAIAEEKGLERLARKISKEHDKLLRQLDQWEELIAEDASIIERVKVANLDELVGWMARKREITIDEEEEEPIMLLLVAESGLPIYSNKFEQTKELQEMLISGFLTSINSFVREAFEVKGMIKRIMHEEYTLSFEVIESILFCYVYEGPSYPAMKKLEKLITEVHESEVWSALEEVSKRGYGLKKGEKERMEGMIGEIFLTN